MTTQTTATAADRPDRRRLRWQCRRGMLELDLLLGAFLERRFPDVPARVQADFVRFLGYQDQIIHDWLIGRSVPAEAAMRELVDLIRSSWAADHAATSC